MKILIILFFTFSKYIQGEMYLKKAIETESTKHFFYINNPSILNMALRENIKIYSPLTYYPGSIIRDELYDKKRGTWIYKAQYNIGDFGFRDFYLPENKKNGHRKHLIIAGESNVFGIGVNGNLTFPALLQKKLSHFQVINLGMPGSSLNHLFYFQEKIGLDKILSNNINKKGVIFYHFQFHLIERLIGSKEIMKWGEDSPWYIVEQGKLKYQGQFRDRLLTNIYKWIFKMKWLDQLVQNWPRIAEGDLDLALSFLIEVERKYKEQTDKNNKFVVILNPHGLRTSDLEIWNLLIKKLKKTSLEFIVLPMEKAFSLETFPHDGHYTSTGHSEIAKLIFDKTGIFLEGN